jgi:hypothetical protein
VTAIFNAGDARGAAVRFITSSTLIGLLFAAPVAAQPAQTIPTQLDPIVVRSTIDAATLADLPAAENIYSVLETTQPEVISDRFNSSGLNNGETARFGGFLGSWSQTMFRIGDLDISDPSGSGAPLVFPELMFWQSLDVVTGLMPNDLSTPGLAVVLEPKRAGTTWTRSVLVSGSGGGLASRTPGGSVPPIARLQDRAHTSALISGPLIPDRLGLVAAGTWTHTSKLIRELAPGADSNLASGFVNLVYAASPTSELRTLGWVQRARVPFTYRQLFSPSAETRDDAAHVQATWEHKAPTGLKWRAFGGFTGQSRANDVGSPASINMERLFDGPVPSIVAASGDRSTNRFALGARLTPPPGTTSRRHTSEFGIDLDRSSLKTSDQFAGSIFEQLDSAPARIWAFTHPNAESRRHATAFAMFASDRLVVSPKMTLDAGLRFESVTGSADGAANGVSWLSLLPRVAVRWQLSEQKQLTLVGGYRRSGNRLNLDLLAYGDPAAPTGTVSRWRASQSATPLVDRIGPGTGGNPDFSVLDPDLKRPYTDEFVVGLEQRRRGWLRLGLTGVARREGNLIALVDRGVPITSYSTVGVPDPGHDFNDTVDDQILLFYNRLPSTFGLNQYVLTNPDLKAATTFALKLTAEGTTDRLFVLFGATASAATGSAANRGFNPTENDQDAIGELFTNPNAQTFARGRLFNDRAFTIKWTTVYRFPWDLHAGVIARYQDGQPSARLVIEPSLNQGAEAVRAFPNGGNRFTFTGTLDFRLQKQFTVGPTRMDAVLDVYNLITRSNEVEEYVVTGPDFRTPTAIEPTPSVHFGVRFNF